jgi:ABC-type transport system involved in multi-copper enzyme maturation permease subunit
MSIEVVEAPPSDGGSAPHRRWQDDWALSWQGVRTVTRLELRQRVRSTRWKVALAVWFVAVGAITLLVTGAFSEEWFGDADSMGQTVFGLVVFFVLFLGLLVAPTLSASSINGDRAAGTLATLQATLLTPAEIVVGKLLAAWAAALAFLVASVPFLIFALAAGGLSVVPLLSVLGVLTLVLGVVCAFGLAFSAVASKTSGSAVLTYLTVAGLSVMTAVVFGLTTPLVTQSEQIRVWEPVGNGAWEDGEPPECEWSTHTSAVVHTERTWWLLAANPFVIVADAQPLPEADQQWMAEDPLSAIQLGVRTARSGPTYEEDWCGYGEYYDSEGNYVQTESPVQQPEPSESPVWPWGLGLYLLLGAGSMVVAVRRLRIPARTLPRGTRVA